MLELARPEDRAAVNVLALQMHQQHIVWRPDLFEEAPELYSEERFASAVNKRELYVSKLDDTIIGYTLLQIHKTEYPGMRSGKVMTIVEFCVHEDCCGHGIGTMMMEDVRALAKAFRCSDLQLHVYPQNDDAVGFFQKEG
jgi:ribosomal protein S18 acetylase RimI-like enzyme